MSLVLYAHPFSSYSQKALIALYENGTPFTYRMMEEDGAGEELAALWSLKRFPILVDDDRTVLESSVVIEHLGLYHPGPVQLIPADPKAALPVRTMDRFFDNYVMTPMQRIVFDHMRSPQDRDPRGVADARAMLDLAYRWLDDTVASQSWACGEAFTLADCAAAPALFYADWTHEIGSTYPHVRAYRKRLLARPSVSRAVEEARPYRHYFPPGAPDRD